MRCRRFCDQRRKFRAVARAVHGAQDALRHVLERDIQVFDDLWLACNHVHQLVRDLVGVEVVQAHPGKVHLAQPAQQFGQQALVLRQVKPVFRDVLRNDDQLFDARIRQTARFFEQRVHFARAVGPAQLGDDAVAAAVGTALRDFEIRGVGRGEPVAAALERGSGHIRHVSRLVPAERGIGRVHNVLIAARAAQRVDLGQFGFHFLRIALHQTAGDHKALHPAGLLVLRHVEDGLDGLALGGLDKPAGVDHAHVGLGHVLGNLPARRAQQGEHVLAVHQVFGAAERNQSYFRHGILLLCPIVILEYYTLQSGICHSPDCVPGGVLLA